MRASCVERVAKCGGNNNQGVSFFHSDLSVKVNQRSGVILDSWLRSGEKRRSRTLVWIPDGEREREREREREGGG